MTEPSQYFKGRTVQEQMDEVIGYVDKRAEEVAAAKADAVLQPAEAAKTAAQAAQAAAENAQAGAEAAKDATLAALPTIQQDISDLKTENVALDGRLNTVELKVQTAEGNIVTIQGQIVDLQTADGQNVKINNINQYAVGLTGNQNIAGIKNFTGSRFQITSSIPYIEMTGSYEAGKQNQYQFFIQCKDVNGVEVGDLILSTDTAGNSQLLVALRKADGTSTTKTIATVNS